MHEIDAHTEKLFSYGTLKLEAVQLSTFDRRLMSAPDRLKSYRLEKVKITDREVLLKSGKTHHPIIRFTGNDTDEVKGFVFDISHAELLQADAYEVDDYKRICVQLASGVSAWVYVAAT